MKSTSRGNRQSKLNLRRETVRILSNDALQDIAGGAVSSVRPYGKYRKTSGVVSVKFKFSFR